MRPVTIEHNLDLIKCSNMSKFRKIYSLIKIRLISYTKKHLKTKLAEYIAV